MWRWACGAGRVALGVSSRKSVNIEQASMGIARACDLASRQTARAGELANMRTGDPASCVRRRDGEKGQSQQEGMERGDSLQQLFCH